MSIPSLLNERSCFVSFRFNTCQYIYYSLQHIKIGFHSQHSRTKITRWVIHHLATYAAYVKMQVTIVVILLSFCASLALPGKEISLTELPAKTFHCRCAMLRSVGRLLAKENIVLVFWADILHVITLFHRFILVPLDKSDQEREGREVSQV